MNTNIKRNLASLEHENMVLENQLEMYVYKFGKYFILDGEVLEAETFNFVRKASPQELEMFYTIRINEMRIRNLKNSLPR